MSLIKKLMQLGAKRDDERDVIKIMLGPHMGAPKKPTPELIDKIERQCLRETAKAGLDYQGTYLVRVYKFGDTDKPLFSRELAKGKLK